MRSYTSLLTGLLCVLLSWSLSQSQDVTDEQETKKLIYMCEFDFLDNCGGTLTPSSLANQITFINTQTFTEDNPPEYKTDISSITKPTDNRLLCKIPFILARRTYYHCTVNLQCETSNGRIAGCFRGRFLGGKVNKRFTDRFVFNVIEINESAVYELKYNHFIYCPSQACGAAGDYIQVILSHTGADGKKTEYKYTETYRKGVQNNETKLWKEETKYVKLEPGNLTMTLLFQRPVINSNPAYFGLDTVSLNQMPDGAITIPETTTPESLEDLSSKDVVLQCDFDRNNCDIKIDSENLNTRVVKQAVISGASTPNDYYITDVSSITKLTENNNTCRIPFYINNVEYFHCTKFFRCETIETNSQDDCQQGFFLSGKSNPAQKVQTASISFPQVVIPEDSYYAIDFHAFITCQQLTDTECSRIRSRMALRYENNQKVGFINFNAKQKSWSKQRAFVTLEKGTLDITLQFIEDEQQSNRAVVHYGFDELIVYRLGSVVYTPLFECSFDKDNCGTQFENDMDDFEMKVVETSQVLQTNRIYRITDVSSIYKPNANNHTCSIPFNYLGSEYFHCTQTKKCVVKETNKNEDCKLGKFLNAKITTAYESQYTVAKFPSVKIDQDGDYKIEYYLFMYCDRKSEEECRAESTDQIVVTWRNNDEPEEIQKHTTISKSWLKQSYSLQLKKGTLDLSVSYIRPNEFQSYIQQFGFDNFELIQMSTTRIQLVDDLKA